MELEEQIQHYLDHPDECYKEWYIEHKGYNLGIGKGEEIGFLADWKKEFEQWVENNILELKQLICPNKSKIKAAATKINIVLEIMELIEEESFVGAVRLSSTLLFIYGIDRLCQGNDNRS